MPSTASAVLVPGRNVAVTSPEPLPAPGPDLDGPLAGDRSRCQTGSVESLDVLRMAGGAPESAVDAGDSIIRFGESNPALCVLVSGVLEVRRNGVALARLSDPGAIVGEMSLLLGTPASADVIAVEPSVVRRIDDAERLFRDVPDFGRYLAITLATRLHRVTTFLGDLEEQFADRPGTLGLVPTVLKGLLSQEQRDVDLGSDREPDSPY